MLFAPRGNAQVLIYRGSMRLDRTGNQTETKLTYNAWIILDVPGREIRKINFFNTGGLKVFSVEDLGGFAISQVASGKNHTNTIIASSQIDSTVPQFTATFLKGPNSQLQVSAAEKHFGFPAVLSWSGRGVAPLSDHGDSGAWEETGVVAFDRNTSMTNNAVTNNIAAVGLVLSNALKAKGFQEVIPK